MKYKIFKEREFGKFLWGIVENESIAMLIAQAFKETVNWKIVYEPCKDIDEDDGWDDYLDTLDFQGTDITYENLMEAYKAGYCKAKEEQV